MVVDSEDEDEIELDEGEEWDQDVPEEGSDEEEDVQEASGGGSAKRARKCGISEEALANGRLILKDLMNGQ